VLATDVMVKLRDQARSARRIQSVGGLAAIVHAASHVNTTWDCRSRIPPAQKPTARYSMPITVQTREEALPRQLPRSLDFDPMLETVRWKNGS
jgi:hypothetical protein